MAEAAVQVSVTVAGWAERARVARAFTAEVTGPGQPCGADAALLVSELSGSRLRHSRPGFPGRPSRSEPGRHCPGGGHRPQRPPGCRSWVPLTAMRKAVVVCSSLRAMGRGGAGGGVAGGR